ncbi:MAG: 5'-deoxynucleotidase [Clostridia bacterium]|nr:5'-deoxynucleotidase [Clostridia bacterium]
MEYDFFAYLSRMKYIRRWALMRSTVDENIKEHSFDVTMIAHALALIENKIFGGRVDEYKVVCLATYHEAGEVITGDLPTPIKYFNTQINSAYKDLEKRACEKLIKTLPEELKGEYSSYLLADEESLEYKIMKSADRISAYLKCVDEVKSGNKEFVKAKASIGKSIKKSELNCVKYFIENVLPSFEKTLDELDFGVE